MNIEDTNNSTYENVKKIYEKINRFLNNDFVSSNIAKLNAYQSKIDKLAQKVEKATQEKAKEPVVVDEKKENVQKIQETKNEENTENEQYNPYSEKFYYKDRLIKLNGNIDKLIQELRIEDSIGHRNSYIIEQINKHRKDNMPITIKKKENVFETFFNKIKSIFKSKK